MRFAETGKPARRRKSIGQGIVTGICAISLFVPVATARVELSPTIDVRQVFSDKVDGTSSGVYTVVSPGVTATVDGQRASASLTYSYDRRIPWQDVNGAEKGGHNLFARGDVELAQDLLYLSAGGLATSINRDRRGPVSLNPDINAFNKTQIFSGYITPSIKRRINSFVSAELSYTLRGFATNEDNLFNIAPRGGTDFDYQLGVAGDSWGHDVTARLISGEAFDKLRWSLTGNYTNDRRDVLNEVFRSYQTQLDIEYAVSRSFSVLGAVGYDDTRINAERSFTDTTRVRTYDEDGITYSGGLRYSPSRKTDLRFMVGRRYGSTTFDVNGRWEPRKGVSLEASYLDSIDPFSSLLTTNIPGFAPSSQITTGGRSSRNRFGVFLLTGIDPLNNIPLFLGTQSINNATTRARSAQLALRVDRRSLNVSAIAFADRRKLLSFVPLPGQPPVDPRVFTEADSTYGVSAAVGRQVSARASWSVGATATRSEYALSSERRDWLYGANVAYRYDLTRKVSAYSTLFHTRRNSNVGGIDRNDTALTLGMRATF